MTKPEHTMFCDECREDANVLRTEIERLSKDNADEIKGSFDHGYAAGQAESTAEIKRLRDALQEIADDAMGLDTHTITGMAQEALLPYQQNGGQK